MPHQQFYAVVAGKRRGIYTDWDLCSASVKYYPEAKYQKFNSLELAVSWMEVGDIFVYTKDGAYTVEQFASLLPEEFHSATSCQREEIEELKKELHIQKDRSQSEIGKLQEELWGLMRGGWNKTNYSNGWSQSTRSMPYTCPLCSKCYAWPGNLSRHVKVKHQADNNNPLPNSTAFTSTGNGANNAATRDEDVPMMNAVWGATIRPAPWW
jgi:hypothetical protein